MKSTFRRRLTLSMTFLSLVVLLGTSAVAYVGIRNALTRSLDDTLLAIARAEVASAVDEPDGPVHVHEESTEELNLSKASGYEKFARILDERGTVIAETSNLRKGPPLSIDADAQARAASGEPVFVDLYRGREVHRAVYFPFHDRERGNRRLVALVAVPKGPLNDSLTVLLWELQLALLIGCGAAAWGASRLARHLTRPLEEIATAAAAVGGQSLDTRLPAVSSDAELRAVTKGLNDMLARLDAAFQAQNRFVSDASHELRSPLSNLRGTIEVALRRSRTADEYRQTLESALREVERLARLANDLLFLSRADSGQAIVKAEACDLSCVAADAVAAHAARAAEASVHLDLDADSPAVVFGDPGGLRQIADNLLDNAIRHAPAGSKVTVSVQHDHGDARMSVRDRGPGLTPEAKAHVFDRFFRADESRARAFGGAGLGLAIANAIAEAHGGMLWVESEVGAGATFTLCLPLHSGGEETQAPRDRAHDRR